ncbi:MAG: hypothetical protein WCL39_06855 [Armatimonadota bacterium]|jgi:hypothetical protein
MSHRTSAILLASITTLVLVSLPLALRAESQQDRADKALASISSDAGAVTKSASAYQWVQVNHQVDRISAAERTIERIRGAIACKALHEAVGELRDARLHRSVDRLQKAAEQVRSASQQSFL